MPWTVALGLPDRDLFYRAWQDWAIGEAAVIHFEWLPTERNEYPLLTGIDWYSETFFSAPQMDSFLEEWGRIENRFPMIEDHEEWAKVRKMALRTQHEALQLVFIGD